MAIQPVQIFGGNQAGNSLEQMLAGGRNVLSMALSNAIQTGRSLADRQTAQERDFFQERERVTQMQQRRAENFQQDLEDQQNFDEGQRRFDVKFGQDERQIDESTRQFNVRQAFAQEQADVSAGLRDRELDRYEENDAEARAERERQLATDKELSRVPERDTRQNIKNAILGLVGLGDTERNAGSGPTEIDVRLEAAQRAGDAEAIKFWSKERDSLISSGAVGAGGKTTSPRNTDTPTKTEREAAQRQEIDRKVSEIGQYTKNENAFFRTERNRSNTPRAEYETALEYPTASLYVKAGGESLTEDDIKFRRAVWHIAHGKKDTIEGYLNEDPKR
jgi:hypothetical protein